MKQNQRQHGSYGYDSYDMEKTEKAAKAERAEKEPGHSKEASQVILRCVMSAWLRFACASLVALILVMNMGSFTASDAGEASTGSAAAEVPAAGGTAQGQGSGTGSTDGHKPEPEKESTGNHGSGSDQGGTGSHGAGSQKESTSESEPASEKESTSEPKTGSDQQSTSEPESVSESESGPEIVSGSESESTSENESGSEAESAQESESGSESESVSESEAASESGAPFQSESSTGQEKMSESETLATETQAPETQEQDGPRKHYVVSIHDAAVRIPEGGRIYDGTDRIAITFRTEIKALPEETKAEKEAGNEAENDTKQSDTKEDKETKEGKKGGTEESAAGKGKSQAAGEKPEKEEKPPEYTVACDARLDSADAGERKVLCSFRLFTEWPDHVRLDLATASPDLRVTVQKAPLHISIADGTKRYGEPADLKHIRMESSPAVSVSGFVRDASGKEMIPQGFVLPEIDVDPAVLDQWSPIYDTEEEAKSGRIRVKEYRDALILKRDAQGRICGEATGNYAFCDTPGGPGSSGGSVRIECAPLLQGVSYEVYGENAAGSREGNGTLIVRYGTTVRVEPVPGQGYNTGAKFTNLKSDGTFRFRLEKRDKNGMLAADSLEDTISCRVDGSVPRAAVTIGGVQASGSILFGASSAAVSVTVPEDGISGLESVRYRILSGGMDTDSVQAALAGREVLSASSEWRNISQNAMVNLSGEQICQVEVETRDLVGNTAISRSPVVVLDSEPPRIQITGVEDGSANASELRIRVQCQDAAFLPGSLKAEVTTQFGGMLPERYPGEETSGGASIRFGDFPRQKKADAVYRLSVSASDRAGNISRKQISFSVNRFGSSYSLADETAEQLRAFYHTSPFDVTFVEMNLDQVGSARVLLRCGERLTQLGSGSGLVVRASKGENGTLRYSYTVPASCFDQDGVYEVMLLTSDQAGNSSDSSAQRLPVRFAIDRTAPECLVSGIRPEGRYQEKELTAVIEIRDNLALGGAQAYVDSSMAVKMDAQQLQQENGILKLKLPQKEAWQTVQVHAVDEAGNETWTKEIPVYISAEDPQEAEDYRSTRLSAQQVEEARKELTTLWQKVSGTKLFFAPQTGTVGSVVGKSTLWKAPGNLLSDLPAADAGSREIPAAVTIEVPQKPKRRKFAWLIIPAALSCGGIWCLKKGRFPRHRTYGRIK